MKALRLDDNELTGPIPKEMGDLIELEILDMHRNDLTSLPWEIGWCKALSKKRDMYIYMSFGK